MERHAEILDALCRVCGKRNMILSQKYKGKCLIKISAHLLPRIHDTFSLDITNDDPIRHPKHLCQSCLSKTGYKTKHPNLAANHWPLHSDSNCKVCQLYDDQCRGGRPPKAKRGRGRPRKEVNNIPPCPQPLDHDADLNIQNILKRPLSSPITKDMEKVATHILKTKLHQSDGLTASFLTGGQVNN